jgi:hypothetical protein
MALHEHFGKAVDTVGCDAFDDVFDLVIKGEVTFGFIPVENTIAGTVVENYDLLFANDRVRHRRGLSAYPAYPAGQKRGPARRHQRGLFPPPCDQAVQGVPEVEGHPPGAHLRHRRRRPSRGCRRPHGLRGHRLGSCAPRSMTWRSWSGISDQQLQHHPFFCDCQQGERAGGPRDRQNHRGLQDPPLSRRPGGLPEDFPEVQPEPHQAGIPAHPGKPWEYVFYAAFEAGIDADEVKSAIGELTLHAVFVKLLGSYPKAEKCW